MLSDQWIVVKHPRLKRDYVGRTVRTLREIETQRMVIPAGTIMALIDWSKGARLQNAPCKCCGIAARVIRVSDQDFEFVEKL